VTKNQGQRTNDEGQVTKDQGQVTESNLSTHRLVPLLPYQRKWIEDASPLKIVVKARQIGFSFAATLRVVLECLKRKTTWILLSKGERQSRLLMEKVQEHIQSCGIVAEARESLFFEGTLLKQLETRFPNGSVIYALPANPDTARGYSGNVTLDEFAFHADADKIYAALYPSITRGYQLEVISTPNGTQGKFYELAKAAGLIGRDSGFGVGVSGPEPRTPNPEPRHWSSHWVDIYDAVRQGLKINVQLLRAGCEDESAWQQEFCCQFISTAENFFSPDLLAACLSAEATTDTSLHMLARESDPALRDSAPGTLSGFGIRGSGFAEVPGFGIGDSGFAGNNAGLRSSQTPNPEPRSPSSFFLGIDIGRHHDRTVFWLDEVVGGIDSLSHRAIEPLKNEESSNRSITQSPNRSIFSTGSISITRVVRTLSNTPFDDQLAYARELLLLRQGSGSPLIRRVAIDATGMGAPLAESLAQEFGARVEPVIFTAAVREDLAYRTKRRMESGLTLLPDSREIRRAFSAVKKFVTVSGNVRFDAARTDAGHADEFWAKALADLAADVRPVAHLSDGYIASGKPIISPSAFMEANENWRTIF